MELLNVKPLQLNGIVKISNAPIIEDIKPTSTDKPFIEANTEDTSLQEISNRHIIGKSAQCDHPNPVEADHPNPEQTDQANPV